MDVKPAHNFERYEPKIRKSSYCAAKKQNNTSGHDPWNFKIRCKCIARNAVWVSLQGYYALRCVNGNMNGISDGQLR